MEFMDTLWITPHEKAVGGVTSDDLNGKFIRDKNVVPGRMRHLGRLMMDFPGGKH